MRSLLFLSALPFRHTSKLHKHFIMRASHPSSCHRQRKMASVLPDSFRNFCTHFFHRRHHLIAPHLSDQQIALAATVYLFRHDSRLSEEFVDRNLDALSRAIADGSGKSIPEARRLFTRGVTEAATEYFKYGWDHVDDFVKANAKELTDVRMQSAKFSKDGSFDILTYLTPNARQLSKLRNQNPKYSAISDELKREPAPEVDPPTLQGLLQRVPVMLMIYADYCSVCKQVRPLFEQASAKMGDQMLFVKLNGPNSPEVKEQYPFTSYPMILRCDSTTEDKPFPKSEYQMTVDNIISFANNHELQPSDSDTDEDEAEDQLGMLTTQRSRTYEWEPMLRKQGIDEIDALRNEQQEALRRKVDSTLESPGCSDSACSISPSRSHDMENGDAPPLCVLLGGGMGAGKSTAVGLIAKTPFWKKYGESIVVVEADALKFEVPLFPEAQSLKPMASHIHKTAINAAGDLFVRAVNARRDIILDGTLSWSEYARQTAMMLRDTEYFWERGPGYMETENGIIEQYWVPGEKRERPAPGYRIELVGVTAIPQISVMRGIVRRITSGRGVPVPDQLRSHALFSKHFEEYIDLADSVYLFDTTMDKTSIDSVEGYARQLVAIKPGLLFPNPDDGEDSNEFVVRYREEYKRFLEKRFINTTAKSASEIDCSTVLIS